MATDSVDDIQQLAAGYRLLSDDQLLDQLNQLPVLPADTVEVWQRRESWELAYNWVAIGEVAAERRLRPAVIPLLQRASVGDPGELMRGLRHTLEHIANPDWDYLAKAYVAAAVLPEPGARLWSIAGLGVLRIPETLPSVINALGDPITVVREEACQALRMLCQTNAPLREPAIRALEQHFADRSIGAAARRAAEAISRDL